MKPAPFDYVAPRSLDEALALLGRHGAEAKILAGGQSLVPLMNMRLARPAVLIDINRVPDLATVREIDGGLVLGALARQRTLELSAVVRGAAPLLAEAAPLIGHLQTRTRGTIGGSCAHADPAAELPACAVALDARLHLASARGRRAVGAAAFHTGLFTTALAPDELLLEVEIPRPPAARTGSAFVEVARRHGDFALVGVAAVIGLDAGGVCRHARLVFLGAGDVPHAAASAGALVGTPRDPRRCEDAGRAAADELRPPADLHASAAYRRRVAGVLAARALGLAWARAEAVRA